MPLDDRYRWVVEGAVDATGRDRTVSVGIDPSLADNTGLVIMGVRPGWVAMEPETTETVAYRLLAAAELLRQQRRPQE